MDNEAILSIIKKCPSLRYKFMGVYASDTFPMLRKNTFQIINTSPNYDVGEHWIMLANKDDAIYFADSMGRCLESYTNIFLRVADFYQKIHRLVPKRLQSLPLCGLYAIYFARRIFTNLPIGAFLHDLEIIRSFSNIL